jgi:hypothetical protein
MDVANAMCHAAYANNMEEFAMDWDQFAQAAEQIEGKHWKSGIARRLGRSPSTIWRWEKKGVIPKTAKLAVMRALDVQPRSQSDMIADALIKALGIKVIG